MELCLDAQKGLIFLAALDMSVDASSASAAENLEFARRLSLHLPDVPEDVGGNFYPDVIIGLLMELSAKLRSETNPRAIALPSGASIPSLPPFQAPRLPEINSDSLQLASCAHVARSLVPMIGGAIDEDLEGSYIAGHLFISAYGQTDIRSTTQLVRDALSMLPPHMGWFHSCLKFSPEEIRLGNPMQKVLSCFVGGSLPYLFGILSLLSDSLHFSGPGQRREQIWTASLTEFCHVAVLEALDLVAHPQVRPHLRDIGASLASEGYGAPPDGLSLQAAVGRVFQEVAAHWGYEMSAEEQDLYLGEKLDRRSCIMLRALINAALNPAWIRR